MAHDIPTPAERAEWRRLADAVKGPLSLGFTEDVPGERYWIIGDGWLLFCKIPDAPWIKGKFTPHAQLFAESKTAIARLLDAVDALEAERDTLRVRVDELEEENYELNEMQHDYDSPLEGLP